MTKSFNFPVKIKGGGREGGRSEVLRPCHPLKFGTCTRITPSNRFTLGRCIVLMRCQKFASLFFSDDANV